VAVKEETFNRNRTLSIVLTTNNTVSVREWRWPTLIQSYEAMCGSREEANSTYSMLVSKMKNSSMRYDELEYKLVVRKLAIDANLNQHKTNLY
jgi:hypothetical protein